MRGGVGDAFELLADQPPRLAQLLLDLDERGMARPERGAEIGLLARDLGVLAAQLLDQAGFQRVGGGVGRLSRRGEALQQVELGFRLGAAGARLDNAGVDLAELLLVEQPAVRADDFVLGLVGLDAGLGVLQARLQVFEPQLQPVALAFALVELGVLLVGEIGLGDGVGDARRLLRIGGGDLDVDDVSALRALDRDGAVERGDGAVDRVLAGARGGPYPEQGEEARAQSRLSGAEFRIVHEFLAGDDAAQHRVRSDEFRLALDQRTVGEGGGALQFGADRRAGARVDQDRGRRGVARRRGEDVEERETRRGAGRGENRQRTGAQNPPEIADIRGSRRSIGRARRGWRGRPVGSASEMILQR